MKKTLFAIAFSSVLVGCGDNSASVSAGSGAENSSDSSSVLAKTKTIFSGSESSKSIKIPAISLISEAFADRVPGHVNDNSRTNDAENKSINNSVQTKFIAGLLFQSAKNNRDDFEKEYKNQLSPRLFNQVSMSEEDAFNGLTRFRMERRIASCTSPMTGWEISPLKNEVTQYVKAIANACDFSNLIYTELAGKIGENPLNNPDAAKEEILKNWDAIPLETLESNWEKIVEKNNASKFTIDGSGVKGVQFTGPGGLYANEGGGFVITKNSSKMFGDGAISGKVIDFNLRSSLGTKMEKSKSLESSQGQQSGSKTGAEIGVK